MKKTLLIFAIVMASFALFSQNNTVKDQNFADNHRQQKDLLMQNQLNERKLLQKKSLKNFLTYKVQNKTTM